MSKVDLYCSYLTTTKQQGQIIILETENKLLELKVSELENIISYNDKKLMTEENKSVRELTELNNVELSLRICELQTKNKLNTISITRIRRSIPDDKQ
jgi:hypothetical protein